MTNKMSNEHNIMELFNCLWSYGHCVEMRQDPAVNAMHYIPPSPRPTGLVKSEELNERIRWRKWDNSFAFCAGWYVNSRFEASTNRLLQDIHNKKVLLRRKSTLLHQCHQCMLMLVIVQYITLASLFLSIMLGKTSNFGFGANAGSYSQGNMSFHVYSLKSVFNPSPVTCVTFGQNIKKSYPFPSMIQDALPRCPETHFDVTVKQPVEFKISIIFTVWIDERLGHFHPSDIQNQLEGGKGGRMEREQCSQFCCSGIHASAIIINTCHSTCYQE